MNEGQHRIAIFISFSGQGGVEHMVNNLAWGFIHAGYRVDMVIARADGNHLESIPEGVNQIRLGTKHTFSALPGLARYLRRENPAALLAVKDRAIRVAVLARWVSGKRVRLVGRIGTTVSAALKGKSPIRKWAWRTGMRLFYRYTDQIVAVSRGVAEDIRNITGLSREKVKAIYNPVVTPDIAERAAEPVGHPWLSDEIPVILGIGRLTKQKDFHTLIRAFAEVRRTRPCRLVILGDGGDLESLRSLAQELGVLTNVDFPGFQQNPFAWLSRSSLFVLSSRWEGFGIVIVEALALGVPVVSTDCPNGPREILKDGRFGPLVPVEDHKALADAMVKTLENPLPSDVLRSCSMDYTIEKISGEYLEKLLQ